MLYRRAAFAVLFVALFSLGLLLGTSRAGPPGGCTPWPACKNTTSTTTSTTTTTPLVVPTIPTGLVATAGDGVVDLTWNPNPSGEQVDTYQVYLCGDTSCPALTLTDPNTFYTHTGLTNGTTYTYRVSAHNAAGYGNWTGTVSATPVATVSGSPDDRWYSVSSAFNKPIPAGTPYRANDASLIAYLDNAPLDMALGGTPAIYFGDSATMPLLRVWDNHPTCHNSFVDAPIPPGAMSPWGMNNSNTQSTMSVMDRATGAEWDFYKVTAPGEPRLVSSGGVSGDCGSPDTWNAEIATQMGGGFIGLGNETCCSGRASRTYQPTGMIRPRDTRLPAGATYDHALVGSYAAELSSFVYPATGTDGGCTDTSICVPMGARFQLDSSYPCDTTPDLSQEYQRQICRTLKVYGWIVVDKPCNWPCSGGNIKGENPSAVQLNIGNGVDGGGGYNYPYNSIATNKPIPTSLLSQMHVIDWTIWTGA
jgi:hypothetical protein